MIVFVFILATINIDGSISVDSSVLDQCPEKTLFTAQMEDKRIHKQILNWQARCYRLDVGEWLGDQS